VKRLKIVVGIPEKKRPFVRLRCRCDDVRMDFKEIA
jgi:hypothetical protein